MKVKKLAGDDGPSMIVSSKKYINSSYEIKQKYQHSITISEENLKFEMWWLHHLNFFEVTW